MSFLKKVFSSFFIKIFAIAGIFMGVASVCYFDEQVSQPNFQEIAELIPTPEVATENRPIFFFNDVRKKIENPEESFILVFQAAVKKQVGPIVASGCLLEFIENPEVNVIKRIDNSSHYLIISKSYIASRIKDVYQGDDHNPEYDPIEYVATNPIECTNLELSLGLKINHMKNEKTYLPAEHPDDNEIQTQLFDREQGMSSIFCTNSDYSTSDARMLRPRWSVFLMGHGEAAAVSHLKAESEFGVICGMSLKNFGSFLDFFNEHVSTRLFTYLSCYAGGINISLVYGENLLESSKKFFFPIMSISLSDLPVVLDSSQRQFEEGILRFRNEMIKDGPIDYYRLGKNLVNPGKQAIQFVASNIQVRYPGTTWFSPVGPKLIAIGKIMAEKRNRPLDIAKFFGRQGRATGVNILLYADNIKFDLIIDREYSCGIGKFLSMIPGDATHRIKKISVRTNEEYKLNARESLFLSFINVPCSRFNKKFLVDEVEILVDGEVETVIKDVFIESRPGEGGLDDFWVCFSQGDKIYGILGDYSSSLDPVFKSDAEKDVTNLGLADSYREELASIKGKLERKDAEDQ